MAEDTVIKKSFTDNYIVTYKGEKYCYSETFDANTGDMEGCCLLHDNGNIILRYDEVLEYVQNNVY